MTPRKPLSFVNDVIIWHRSLTHTQQSDVRSWLDKNPAPPDWQGTPVEWAYLNMPVPESW
jgi:hypothetical protein